LNYDLVSEIDDSIVDQNSLDDCYE